MAETSGYLVHPPVTVLAMGLLLLALSTLAFLAAGLLWRSDAPAPQPTSQSAAGEKPSGWWSSLTNFGGRSGQKTPANGTRRSRKERQAWAEKNGFTYSRDDEFLEDEWGRGAASSGEPVRDVLAGSRFGHETRIADIGSTTVVAMGTGMVSAVVADMRRGIDAPAGDLFEVAEVEGFTVLASDVGPVERMLDIRVSTALEMLPPQVSAVWFEGEWVIAQLDAPCDWETVFPPLALLADAARTLPPETWPRLDLPEGTREMGEPVAADHSGGGAEEPAKRPTVVRPEEPLELPTRQTGGVRGPITHHGVGTDEVSAIATGAEAPKPNDGTRAARRTQPPSIFGD